MGSLMMNEVFVFLVILVNFYCFKGTLAVNFGCLNHRGQFVDWWVIYKEAAGRRYVYLDSSGRVDEALGLHRDRSISSSSSPLSRTIASSGYPHQLQNTISLAWNDQPSGASEFSKQIGHAKGFMGIRNDENNVIESFLIQHSMPRFPASSSTFGFGHFDSNLDSKAQHFLCISMRDELPQRPQNRFNSIIPIESVLETNLFKILWNYARVVNVGFINQDFSQYSHDCRSNVFKEILQILPNYSLHPACKMANFKDIEDHLKAKLATNTSLNSFTITSTGGSNALKFRVFAKGPNNRVDLYDDVTSLFSIHHEDYSGNIWGTLKTGHSRQKTAMLMVAQSHTDPATLGINQKILVDRSDFFATVHILNSSSVNLPEDDGESCKKKCQSDSEDEFIDDENENENESVMDTTLTGDTNLNTNNASDSTIESSAMDITTLDSSPSSSLDDSIPFSPIPSPLFTDKSDLFKSPELNSSLSKTPSLFKSKRLSGSGLKSPSARPTVLQHSMYRDHSKWSVNMIYGVEGPFPALMCFYDLNRSSKQTARGGGAFCLNSSLTGSSRASMRIWSLFMSFSPKATDMARFNDAKVTDILDQVLDKVVDTGEDDQRENDQYTSEEDDEEEKVDDEGSFRIKTRSHSEKASIKRRRRSIDHLFTIKRSRDSSQSQSFNALPTAKYLLGKSSQNNLQVSINSRDSIIVPCPYKVRRLETTISSSSSNSRNRTTRVATSPSHSVPSTSIPTKVYLDIKDAIYNYGLEPLNELLEKSKLAIVRIGTHLLDTLASPELQGVKYLNDRTLLVKQGKTGDEEDNQLYSEDEFVNRMAGNI